MLYYCYQLSPEQIETMRQSHGERSAYAANAASAKVWLMNGSKRAVSIQDKCSETTASGFCGAVLEADRYPACRRFAAN